MLYMVQGYICISIYNFILHKPYELNHLFFKSVVCSYVIKVIFDSIFSKLLDGSFLYTPLLLLTGAIIGYVFALIVQSECFNDILLKAGIRRTTNQDIWADVIKPFTWVMYYCKDGAKVYYGQFKYGDESGSEPVIALVRYQVISMDGEVIEDNSSDPNQVVLLNTKSFERIELTYEEQEKKIPIDKILAFLKKTENK